jgi:hypothetical protein
MKLMLIVIFGGFALISFGQVQDKKVQVQERIIERNPPFTLNDTTIDVIYTDKQFEYETPACFINSTFSDWISIITISPEAIKDVKVTTRDTTIHGIDYSDQIHLQTHDSIPIDLMTLSEIKRKYTKCTTGKCIYILNNRLRNNEEIIITNPELKIDKNYIFRIKIEKLSFDSRKPKKTEQIDVIRILFRTKENIEEANKIWIR